MKILVATSDVPFVEGGHRVIARALVEALRQAGHQAEIFTTPQNRFGRQFSAYLATHITDVEVDGSGERIDRLISLRFPSYVLQHPHHVCWLNHRMREYYDLWPDWTVRLSWKGKIKETVRRTLIHCADRHYLKRLRKVFAQSRTVQEDLRRWGGISSEVLYPPPPQRDYGTDSYEDFILSPARLVPLKRVPLLIEALARTRSGKAVILGTGEEHQKILDLIHKHSLENRVELRGHVREVEMLNLYRRCRAVYYAPVREDFGLVTVEAFHCRKPLITAHDSGGPAEIVRNGISGFIIEPEPGQLAEKITTLLEDRDLAENMGQAAYESVQNISWANTVARLLE